MSQRCELPSPSLRRIRALSALIAAVVLTALVVSVPATPAGADADWLQTINSFRAQNGRPALQLDPQLSGLAQQQAQAMASAGQLMHTPNLAAGVTANWTKLGENVGRGTTRGLIWTAFLGSAPHLANLTDGAFTHIGIGVVNSGGEEWVVHRFMAAGAPAPPPQQQPQPEPEPEPVYVPPPVTQPPAPRVTAPPATVPPATIPTATTTIPAPEPVVVPAASAPDRAAALLDALHRIER